jgi:hypothetical protein
MPKPSSRPFKRGWRPLLPMSTNSTTARLGLNGPSRHSANSPTYQQNLLESGLEESGSIKAPSPYPNRAGSGIRHHVHSVAKQPCLVCGRRPSDPRHLRFAQNRALGRKVSDEFVVPLCRGHHREVHRCGDEATWWSTVGVNPMVAARALWLQTHRQSAAHDQAIIESLTSNSETKPFAGAGAL